jgi:hypothetical protein
MTRTRTSSRSATGSYLVVRAGALRKDAVVIRLAVPLARRNCFTGLVGVFSYENRFIQDMVCHFSLQFSGLGSARQR